MRRKLFNAALWVFLLVLLSWQLWQHVRDFHAFQAMHAGAGLWEYLVNLSPLYWAGVLACLAMALLNGWWNHSGNNVGRADLDDESKRKFLETRGH